MEKFSLTALARQQLELTGGASDSRHSLEALEDSAVLLTVAMNRPPSS